MTTLNRLTVFASDAGHGEADFGFDIPLDRTAISSMKWEAEISRTRDPELLCFGTAEMDFQSAPAIRDALKQAVEVGYFGYPLKWEAYFEAITGYYERRFGWQIEKDWIASHVGIYPSMQPIFEELTDPGDEIIYQPPVHHIFEEMVSLNNRVALPNPLLKRGRGYEIDFDDLATKVTAKTRLLLLCNPHNPVGRVWRREELERLSRFCLEHGIVVVTDEVYCGLLFDGVSYTPFASLSHEASMNSITLTSASKSFNLSGFKHSLVIAENPELRHAYMTGLMRSNIHFGGSVLGMVATEAAFRDCDDWSAALMRYIADNFAFMVSFLTDNLPFVKVTQPESTYFAWLDFSDLSTSADDLTHFFEQEAHVTVGLGEGLGTGGKGHIRFNLATSRSILAEGLCRINEAYQRRLSSIK